MIQPLRPRFQSFEEYLAYDGGSDKLYEHLQFHRLSFQSFL
jgi:hypothetical protein